MRRMLMIFLALVAVAAPTSAQTPASGRSLPSDTRITLEEDGLLITITAEVRIAVEGETGFEFDILGVKERIGSKELNELVSEFIRMNYLSMNDRYEDKDHGCPVAGGDCSSVGIVTSFRLNGRSKRIAHHIHACLDRDGLSYPRELTNLEQQIKDVVGLRRR